MFKYQMLDSVMPKQALSRRSSYAFVLLPTAAQPPYTSFSASPSAYFPYKIATMSFLGTF